MAVKIREMVAISTPMAPNLAVRVRNTSRFCPLNFRAGRLSKKAGTPEAKLRKNPNRETMTHPAPATARARLGIMSSAVPTTPRTMDRTNATRRPLPVLTTAPSFRRSK